MEHAIVTLKKGEGRTIKAGGAWIYDNEIASVVGSFDDGDVVLIHDFDGYPLGRGFINTNSRAISTVTPRYGSGCSRVIRSRRSMMISGECACRRHGITGRLR